MNVRQLCKKSYLRLTSKVFQIYHTFLGSRSAFKILIIHKMSQNKLNDSENHEICQYRS